MRARSRLPVTLRVLSLALACAACSHPAPDATPEGALRTWLERMEESQDDSSASREAYVLLGPAARANLEERAKRASQAQGRRAEPHEMLATGRFGLKFRPKSMHASVVGDQATVEVIGADPSTEHATVRCVHEPAGWRVEPGLPDVTALPKRGDGG
jgi:hypothetical protein